MMESMDPGILDSCGGTAGQLRPVQEILDASTVARDDLDEQLETVSAEKAKGLSGSQRLVCLMRFKLH